MSCSELEICLGRASWCSIFAFLNIFDQNVHKLIIMVTLEPFAVQQVANHLRGFHVEHLTIKLNKLLI